MNTEQIQKIEHSMMYLASFSRSYSLFNAIYGKLDELDYGTGNLFPFKTICNALLSDSAVSWCKVFGSNAEETHWKTIIPEHDEFRDCLLDNLNIEREHFTQYWKKMKTFRDNVVAHFNAEHFSAGSTPLFDIAELSSAFTHKYMRQLLPCNVDYSGPLCLIQYGRSTANAALSRLFV